MYSINQRIAKNIAHILSGFLPQLKEEKKEVRINLDVDFFKQMQQIVKDLECSKKEKFPILNSIMQTQGLGEAKDSINKMITALVFNSICEELGQAIKDFFKTHASELNKQWERNQKFIQIQQHILRQPDVIVVKKIIYAKEVQELIKESIPTLCRDMHQLAVDIDNTQKIDSSDAALEVVQDLVGMAGEPDEIIRVIEEISANIILSGNNALIIQSSWMQAAAQRIIERALGIFKLAGDIEKGWRRLEEMVIKTQYEKDIFNIFINDFYIEGMAAGYDHWIKTGSWDQFPAGMSEIVYDAIKQFERRKSNERNPSIVIFPKIEKASEVEKKSESDCTKKITKIIAAEPEISAGELIQKLTVWRRSLRGTFKGLKPSIEEEINIIKGAAIHLAFDIQEGRLMQSEAGEFWNTLLLAKTVSEVLFNTPAAYLMAHRHTMILSSAVSPAKLLKYAEVGGDTDYYIPFLEVAASAAKHAAWLKPGKPVDVSDAKAPQTTKADAKSVAQVTGFSAALSPLLASTDEQAKTPRQETRRKID